MSKKRNASLQEIPLTEISEDRRSKRRYPINLPVQYKVLKNYLVMGTGSGNSLDLSSGGISFSSPEPLRVGSYLEVSVSWPVLLNHSCPLKLVATGRVVRSDKGCTAIRLDRYEFRTHGGRISPTAGTQPQFAIAFQ